MDVLLATIAQKNVRCAILDLTGVSSVDAGTAEHLVRLVRAVELLGARALVVGLKAEVARAIVSLGLGLDRVETRATLRDALRGVTPMGAPQTVRSGSGPMPADVKRQSGMRRR